MDINEYVVDWENDVDVQMLLALVSDTISKIYISEKDDIRKQIISNEKVLDYIRKNARLYATLPPEFAIGDILSYIKKVGKVIW